MRPALCRTDLQVAGGPGAGQIAGDEQYQRQLQDMLAVDVAEQPGGQWREQHISQREYRYQLPACAGLTAKVSEMSLSTPATIKASVPMANVPVAIRQSVTRWPL